MVFMRFFIVFMGLVIGCGFSALAEEAPSSPPSSGNPSNDKLLGLTESEQAAMLSKATHYNCLGKKPYYMGTQTQGSNKGVSFWSITCINSGDKFMIVIAPDEVGSTKLFSCRLLHGHPWDCYEKIKEQR